MKIEDIQEEQVKLRQELHEIQKGQEQMLNIMTTLVERIEGETAERRKILKEEHAEYSRLFRSVQPAAYPTDYHPGWAGEAIRAIRAYDQKPGRPLEFTQGTA